MKKINKNLLIKTAKKSDHKINMHATLIISKGRLIARGYNHGHIHSEIDALIRSNRLCLIKDLKGAIAVNLMIKRKNGNKGNSRPCENCLERLKIEGVKIVIYFDGYDFVEEKIKDGIKR